MTVARTKAARQQRIVDLLGAHEVRSQAELARLLADDRVEVTQATLSRDLDELGAVRVRTTSGQLVYAVAPEGGSRVVLAACEEPAAMERLSRRLAELLVSAEASGNIAVLRTPPGGAHFLASAIDHGLLADVIGTVAGDDTVLLVTADVAGGESVAQHLLDIAAAARVDADAASPPSVRTPEPHDPPAPEDRLKARSR